MCNSVEDPIMQLKPDRCRIFGLGLAMVRFLVVFGHFEGCLMPLTDDVWERDLEFTGDHQLLQGKAESAGG